MPDPLDSLLRVIRVGYFGLGAGAFLFFFLWEGGRPRIPFPSRGRHVLRNLALLALVVLFADVLVGDLLLGIPAHLTAAPRGLLSPLALPTAMLAVLGLLAIDFACYLYHRLSHRLRRLWLLHATHHTDPHLDVSTALRFHPLDMAFYVIVIAGTLLVLGVPLWVAGLHAVLVNPQFMLQHANVTFPRWVERGFAWLFVTPAIHHVHHSALREETDANYGQMLSCWDRLLGTYRAPGAEDPPRIGVTGHGDDRWQTLSGMLATPWNGRRSL